MLAAWLAMGVDFATKTDHWKEENKPTRDQRRAARFDLKHLGGPDAAGILDAEADPPDGEETEPEDITL